MNIKAVGTFVVVGSKQNKPCGYGIARGKVLSVGDSVDVKIHDGDIIFFYESISTNIGGKFIVRQSDIIAIDETVDGDGDVEGFGDLETTGERCAIYREIESERDYQDAQYGGAEADDELTMDRFVSLIKEYSSGKTKRVRGHGYRVRLVKTAALAVAALESFDRRTSQQYMVSVDTASLDDAS